MNPSANNGRSHKVMTRLHREQRIIQPSDQGNLIIWHQIDSLMLHLDGNILLTGYPLPRIFLHDAVEIFVTRSIIEADIALFRCLHANQHVSRRCWKTWGYTFMVTATSSANNPMQYELIKHLRLDKLGHKELVNIICITFVYYRKSALLISCHKVLAAVVWSFAF